ncbi:hypothetical protein ID866_1906 [Astraeus odoratus]|nr:hypothetical protein ID866_1906 [Astraeus odoratus]
MVTPGAIAVCLCFPCTGAIDAMARAEDARIIEGKEEEVDPTVFWMKQTISNACGTMALIHALANSDVTLTPESPLATFIDECKDKTPLERADLLRTTSLFSSIHASAATSGQTDASTADMNTNLHFTTFVRAPAPYARARVHEEEGVEWRVVELDGRRVGPIDRGKCEDLLKDVANYVKDVYVPMAKSVQFSMMALCPGSP